MIRRLLRALDRDHAVAAIAIVCAVVGYGYVQQADDQAQSSTLTACEGCGKTVVVAKE